MSDEYQPVRNSQPLPGNGLQAIPSSLSESDTPDAVAPVAGAEASSIPHPAVSWLPVLEAVQKIGLLLLSCVYAIGYVVWAYYAWRYNLGPLPAVQTQYLMAGIGPTLIISITLMCIYKTAGLLDDIGRVFLPYASRNQKRCGKVLICVYVVACVILIVLLGLCFRHSLTITAFCLALGCYHIAVLGTNLIFRFRENTHTSLVHSQYTAWPIVSVVPVLIGALFVCVYCRFVFPILPQEFGGAMPRVAQLDISRDSLSLSRLKALIPVDSLHSNSKILISKPLSVFFASSQFLLVKPYMHGTTTRAYEVEVSTIKGIIWLDPGDAVLNRSNKTPAKHPSARLSGKM